MMRIILGLNIMYLLNAVCVVANPRMKIQVRQVVDFKIEKSAKGSILTSSTPESTTAEGPIPTSSTPEPTTGCPYGFFAIENPHQCFKLLLPHHDALFKVGSNFSSNWTEASARCRDEGLILAQPSPQSSVALIQYIHNKFYETYGNIYHKNGFKVGLAGAWLGASRATNASEVLWHNQKYAPTPPAAAIGTAVISSNNNSSSGVVPASGIPRGSPLWDAHMGLDGLVPPKGLRNLPQEPNKYRNCVVLMGGLVWENHDPESPYGLMWCHANIPPLCQAIDPEKE